MNSEEIIRDGKSARCNPALLKWSQGDQEALEDLLPMVYRELHKIAHRYLNKERGEHTLQTTALVHEAYIKLIDQTRVQWQNRAHFFGIAAQAMRRILVDNARQRLAGKRGKGAEKISIDDKEIDISDEKASNLVELDFALKKLAELEPNKSRLVELRYFGGLSLEETAEVLGVSRPTVIRQWRLAKAWLYKEISGEDSVKDKG
jgi:RNA polymerase sigma factor (TIGR02999 family)